MENKLVDSFLNKLHTEVSQEVLQTKDINTMVDFKKPKHKQVFSLIDYDPYMTIEPIEFSLDDMEAEDVISSKGHFLYGDKVVFLYRKYQFYNLDSKWGDIEDPDYVPQNPYYHLFWCSHLREKVPERSISRYFSYTNRHSGNFECIIYDNVTIYGKSFERGKTPRLEICPSCYKDLYLASKGYKPGRDFDLDRYFREACRGLYKRDNNFNKANRNKILSKDYSVIRKDIADFIRKRDHNRCCECGKYGPNLEVHHKDENRMNNNLENLALICTECHNKHHPHRKDIINIKK